MPRHKNCGGCIETMSRSEASPIQTIHFHHPSLSALSPLPLFIQSIRVMLSFPPFPLFFLVYLVIKKRDRLTRTLYCTEMRIACVHTNFHTKCSSCKDWQLNIEVDSQSAPLLEKFTNSFCKPCHSSCQSDVFVFLISASLLRVIMMFCGFYPPVDVHDPLSHWLHCQEGSVHYMLIILACRSKGEKAVTKHYNKWFRDCFGVFKSCFSFVCLFHDYSDTYFYYMLFKLLCVHIQMTVTPGVFLGWRGDGISLQ